MPPLFKDHHHLTPKSRGGEDIESNLLLIKRARHILWHKLWKDKTLSEIITILKKCNDFPEFPLWKELWGERSSKNVTLLLQRVYRIKRLQHFHLFFN